MSKQDIFTFTAPNGVEVTACVLAILRVYTTDEEKTFMCVYLCYAQNRLFKVSSYYGELNGETKEWSFCVDSVIVDYAILPDYDELLKRYSEIEIAQAETALGM